MPDMKKIRIMTKLAKFEAVSGIEELKLSRYYRKDYIGIALFKTFFWTTLAYFTILLLTGVYLMDYFMENMHKMNLQLMIMCILGGYIIVLTIYMLVTYARCRLKYNRSQRKLTEYDKMLKYLEKSYMGENRNKYGEVVSGRKHV